MQKIVSYQSSIFSSEPIPVYDESGGMTLRDYFAGQAMLVRSEQNYESWGDYADDCYDIADAMLKRREK